MENMLVKMWDEPVDPGSKCYVPWDKEQMGQMWGCDKKMVECWVEKLMRTDVGSVSLNEKMVESEGKELGMVPWEYF